MPAELTKAIPVIATDAAPIRHRRPCIPPSPLHVAGDLDVPPVARAVGVEAYRRRVDALAADLYPARQLEAAREREAHLAALIDDAMRDGATTGAAIAARLTAMGVGVRR